jgi:hypothetical protein
MATNSNLVNAFGEQPNPFMADPSDINEYQTALQQSLTALEQRYAQPNWFKVAAGFAKPQLGGFMASLGSANEALGENLEQQRAQEFPIAQLRAQLASSKVTMGQRKKAADIFSESLGIPAEDAQKILSGQKPLPAGAHKLMRPEIAAQLTALDPKIGAAANEMVQSARAEQELTNKANASAIENAAFKQKYGFDIPGFVPVGSGNNPSPASVPDAGSAGALGATASAAAPASSTPQATAAVAAPRKTIASGKYVIDPKVLDNLGSTESSGNELAINLTGDKPSKAMGKYQFEPETVVALHKQGLEFNPLKGDDARYAASQYLGQLLDKNNGDINKALAQYGGFKTKDPSDYIGKVLKGVDNPVTIQADQTNQPASSTQPSDQTFNQPSGTTTYTGQGATGNAKLGASEEKIKAQDVKYQPLLDHILSNDPLTTSTRETLLTREAELLGTPGVIKGTGLLYKDKGYQAAALSALQAGVSGSVGTSSGGANIQVAFPVENTLTKTKLEPEEQQQLREYQIIKSQLASQAMRDAVRSVGGGHLNLSEFQNALTRVTSSSDPHKILQAENAKSQYENERDAKLYDLWGQHTQEPNFAVQPLSSFFHGKNYTGLIKSYTPKISKAHRLAD